MFGSTFKVHFVFSHEARNGEFCATRDMAMPFVPFPGLDIVFDPESSGFVVDWLMWSTTTQEFTVFLKAGPLPGRGRGDVSMGAAYMERTGWTVDVWPRDASSAPPTYGNKGHDDDDWQG